MGSAFFEYGAGFGARGQCRVVAHAAGHTITARWRHAHAYARETIFRNCAGSRSAARPLTLTGRCEFPNTYPPAARSAICIHRPPPPPPTSRRSMDAPTQGAAVRARPHAGRPSPGRRRVLPWAKPATIPPPPTHAHPQGANMSAEVEGGNHLGMVCPKGPADPPRSPPPDRVHALSNLS